MNYSILIVEDEKKLSNIISDILKNENFNVFQAFDGNEGLELFFECNPSLILLDINLPKKNGWELCREIRLESNIPILMMTARDSEFDEIHGLELGADDYITKPFNLKVLLLKIKKHLKLDNNFTYNFKQLKLDFSRHIYYVNDEKINFSKKEEELLKYFIINRKKTLTRDMLLNEIWGYGVDVEDRVVDTLIKRVRKKIKDYSEMIKTIRGVGYIFDEN